MSAQSSRTERLQSRSLQSCCHLVTEAITYWKECLMVYSRGRDVTVVASPLVVCKVVGERGQLMIGQDALKIRSWADVFRLESGVTTEGWTSLFFYYDHKQNIIRNTQLLYMLHCS